MSEPHRNILSVGTLRRDALMIDDPRQLEQALQSTPGDALLLEWNEPESDPASDSMPSDPVERAGVARGLFAVLGAAARQQRVVFPARWLRVRPEGSQGGPTARLLAFARSDAALQRLFAPGDPELKRRGLSRPDEPLILLGCEGDALVEAASSGPAEFRRRAEQWISRLGADRIVLAVPSDAGPQHPLVELAGQRALPLFRVGAVGWTGAKDESNDLFRYPSPEQPMEGSEGSHEWSAGEVSADVPLLWTDFQLDSEHRLPDDSCIAGLRDLLHRGALLRERTIYDRLPSQWRTRVDAELRALYSWHVSPLLRRVTAGLQLLDAVDGVHITAPMPQLRSVSAWLLGLTDQRPHADVLASEDPVRSARHLASALQEFDRRISVRVSAVDWPRLHARMAAWAEGGFLARVPGSPVQSPEDHSSHLQFCYSGQPLTHRAPLRRGMDGIDTVELARQDLTELGWLRIECTVEESGLAPSSSALPRSESSGSSIPVYFDRPAPDRVLQLALDLGAESPYQERSA